MSDVYTAMAWIGQQGGNPGWQGLERAAHARVRIRDHVVNDSTTTPSWTRPSAKTFISAGRKVRTMVTRRTRRKRMRRRGRGRKGRAALMWPRQRLVRFKVVTKFSLTEAAGAVSVNNIGVNTLSDPHYSIAVASGGASNNLPLGLDQWAAMYKKYAIVGSRHFVKVHNLTSTGAVAYGLTLRQGGESSSLASAEAYMETPMTRSRILSPDMDHSGLGISYSAKRYWRFRKIMDDDTQQASFTTTPADVARPAYAQFWFQDIHNNESCTIEGYVTSEYIALLFDPVTPARSAV